MREKHCNEGQYHEREIGREDLRRAVNGGWEYPIIKNEQKVINNI